jgi:diguanylate cyclase (GGDEF)-like protein
MKTASDSLLAAAPSLPDSYNNAIHGLAIGPDVGACGTAAFLRERVICADIANDPRWKLFAEVAATAGLGACWSEPILDAEGQVLGTFAIYHSRPHAPSTADISTLSETVQVAGFAIERSRAERTLNDQLLLTRQLLERAEQSSKVLDSALDNMSQGLAMFDRHQRLIVCNDKYLKLYAIPLRLSTPGTSLTEILKSRIANGVFSGANPDDYLRSRSGFGTAPDFANNEVLESLTDGRTIRVTRRSIDTGGWVTTHEDVTELRRKEAQIEFMAHHDALTGLVNRVAFNEKLEEATLRLIREEKSFNLLMLDLDRFKKINDSFGHAIGDALLVEVSSRLKTIVKNSGTVARLGGDEFAIVQTSAVGLADELAFGELASELAKRILSSLSEPFDLEGHQVMIGVSIGIALAPDDGMGAEHLLKRADLALYSAKSKGRNVFTFFSKEMMAKADARNTLESDMRLALKSDEFEVHYQLLVEAKTRNPIGAEALVRWRHPEQGLIPPNRFIPIAEETGLINEIGEWVLRQACQDAAGWPPYIKVAVNLSAVQFQQSHLLAVITRALHDSGLPPNRLEVEVTESVLLDHEADYVTLLHQLKSIGISVALDDFGTGYSSLSYLKQFPFDRIKIDRSFTEDITEQSNSLAIVAAVVGLARGLHMITTAEGIETEEQFEIMRLAGVTHAQGFLFGRPCPKSELKIGQTALPARHSDSGKEFKKESQSA